MVVAKGLMCLSYDKANEIYDAHKAFVGDNVRLFDKVGDGFVDGTIDSIASDGTKVTLESNGTKTKIATANIKGFNIYTRGDVYRRL